jgi:hypothetical protein
MTELNTPERMPPPQAGVADQKLLQAYRQVLLCVFIATLCVIVVLIGVYVFGSESIFLFVIGAGVVGALFSSLLRLYNYEDLPKALTDTKFALTNLYLIIYALVPLVIGAIAATALYLAFMSGLLKGDLFPMFVCHDGAEAACKSLEGFAQRFAPSGPEDYAKALVWGFLSGFSERLVPDLLQNIAKTKDK